MVRRLAIPNFSTRALCVCLLCAALFFPAFALLGFAGTQDQSAAEAARQEHTRKQAQQKKSQHVYTEEDLKRSQILIPEDRDCAQTAKKNAVPVNPQNAPATLDAQSRSAIPLGDVARKLRAEKSARETEQALKKQLGSGFHLGLPTAALAAPRPAAPLKPVAPPRISPRRGPEIKLWSPLPSPAPVVPRSPYAIKRVSPFQPRPFVVAPRTPVSAAQVPPASPHTDSPAGPQFAFGPSAPLVPRRAHAYVVPAAPRLALSLRVPAEIPLALSSREFPVAPPASIQPRLASPRTSAIPAAPAAVGLTITVKSGDSLWKLSKIYLGNGANWKRLAAVNSSIVDPSRLMPGQQLVIPAASSARIEASGRTIKVRSGDSLWKLARTYLGHGAAWTCLAQADPVLAANPERLSIGQVVAIPTACHLTL